MNKKNYKDCRLQNLATFNTKHLSKTEQRTRGVIINHFLWSGKHKPRLQRFGFAIFYNLIKNLYVELYTL